MSGTGSFVAKRFLLGVAGDLVNADHIRRIFIHDNRLYAELGTGPNIELVKKVTGVTPTSADVTMVDVL